MPSILMECYEFEYLHLQNWNDKISCRCLSFGILFGLYESSVSIWNVKREQKMLRPFKRYLIVCGFKKGFKRPNRMKKKNEIKEQNDKIKEWENRFNSTILKLLTAVQVRGERNRKRQKRMFGLTRWKYWKEKMCRNRKNTLNKRVNKMNER